MYAVHCHEHAEQIRGAAEARAAGRQKRRPVGCG